MTTENSITRRLEYADRLALQQADQAIRKDVVRALVELITNCNDSYQRMDDINVEHSGKIVIELERKFINSVLRVYDNAEGMSEDDMDKKVGKYGEATSGFTEGKSVRGLWGRGLKDSFFGLGHGNVSSIRDDKYTWCSLSIISGKPTYQRKKSIKANRAIKNQYELPFGNGTVMEIIISRDEVRIPQFDNLRRNLERHFELRAIMSNPKRTVVLRDLDSKGKIKTEVTLKHNPPIGIEVFDESFCVTSQSIPVHMQVFRANELLSTPAEEGEYADGGLIIASKGIVLALTLLKFDHNEYAARFYGYVICDHLHTLLKSDSSILTATRDGINWKHEFAKSLKESVEKHLEPLVDAERKRIQAEQRSTMNRKLRERLNEALNELNSIADSELGETPGQGKGTGGKGPNPPYVPPSGFGFVPEYAYIQTGKPMSIILRANVPEKVDVGCLITIESDSPEVLVLTPQVMISNNKNFTGVGEAKVELEGRQVGVEAVITARLGELKAEAIVKVISKREPNLDSPPKKEKGGLFRDVKFDPTAAPQQRVKFLRADSDIVIATQAPSVSTYLDEHGNGSDTPQGQVLLAELITEAVCFEIARRGVENGVFIAIQGSEADAIRREHINLQNKYAHKIHGCFVDPSYRRNGNQAVWRKGRPSKDQQLAKELVGS